MNNVHFSHNSNEWETPQDFFDRYNQIFKFDLDVCASDQNAKCTKYFTIETDGLRQNWQGNCWMNPPYGRGIKDWVKKAYESAQNGATICCLLPARTDTTWWHDYCMKGQIEFIKGRLKFGNSKNSAPFPNAIIIFYSKKYDWRK